MQASGFDKDCEIMKSKKNDCSVPLEKTSIPSQLPGVNLHAVHINSARQMFNLSVRSRYPDDGGAKKLPTAKPLGIAKSNANKEPSFSAMSLTFVPGKSIAPSNTVSVCSSASSNCCLDILNSSEISSDVSLTASTSIDGSDIVADKFEVSIPAKSHEGECNNPQCYHCGSVIIPSPASSFPVQDSPSISVNNWEIFTVRKPILKAKEIDMYEEQLSLPFPEMIFGKNEVRIQNTKHNWGIVFNSIDALDTVLKIGCDPNKLLKVAHSKHWFDGKIKKSKSRIESINVSIAADSVEIESRRINEKLKLLSDLYNTYVSEEDLNANVTKMIKPYDWTYTPRYDGTILYNGEKKYEFCKSELEIPINKLKVHDKILFFDDVMLYEDELADNGISVLSCKIRVMQQRLLLLTRFFLRIDDVIFKIRDVRLFIEFQDNLVIRDIKEQEDTYANVFAKASFLSSDRDPRLRLRDSNWVSGHLPVVSHTVEEIKFSE